MIVEVDAGRFTQLMGNTAPSGNSVFDLANKDGGYD